MTTFPTYDTVDLFAGPGGWSVAAQQLGLREMGIEFDKAAHETRRAAGFSTIRDDVRNWGPANFPNATGLIASPPCQTFSMAGKGAGRAALDTVLAAIHAEYVAYQNGMALAEWLEISDQAIDWSDERTSLVIEPLRWALEALRLGQPYEWLAFEQVPTVLPVWQAMAEMLRTVGYNVATGNVQAEQYGVPQTRKRAILVAHLHKEVALPTPTHSRYYSRNPTKLDPGVQKWVSMAEALGWGMTRRPSMTVTGGGAATGGAEPFGNASRQGMLKEIEAGRWLGQARNAGPGAERDPRPLDAPSYTIRAHGSGTAPGGVEWVSRPVEEQPEEDWPYDRPSTTIVGSFRPEMIAAPGWRKAGDGPRQNAKGSIKVTAQEAAVLQSFPVDYPWAGAKGKQFQQIGNAIPPGLASAVLRACANLGKENA